MNRIKVYEKNTEGCDYIVGDLHGCYKEFNEVLAKINFNKETDRMFSVGDLVDRGEDSLSCLKLIHEPWFHCVKGNHEDMMCKAVPTASLNRWSVWLRNGGDWATEDNLAEMGWNHSRLRKLVKEVQKLPVAIEVENHKGQRIGITHAEPPMDWDHLQLSEEEVDGPYFEQRLIWAREKIGTKEKIPVDNIDYTVHGHTPIDYPMALGNSLFIDTGCVFNGISDLKGGTFEGYLTCIALDEIEDLIQTYQYKEEE